MLHHAAGAGDGDLARLLLDLGADRDVHDGRFDATAAGWAEHPELLSDLGRARPAP